MEIEDICFSVQRTVTCPFGVSGGSHVITIVDELSGRT